MNTLEREELAEHLMLTLTLNIAELYPGEGSWSGGHLLAELERKVQLRATELGAELAFGPPVLTETNWSGERGELLTWPLVPEGKLRSEIVTCSTERCSCVWHRINERERRPAPALATSALRWPEQW